MHAADVSKALSDHAALPPFTAALALKLAPVRVNLIAAGFVDARQLPAGIQHRLGQRGPAISPGPPPAGRT